jgi:hypothetical protein
MNACIERSKPYGLVFVVMASTLIGCAGVPAARESVHPSAGQELTARDFERVNGARTLLDGVAHLRPHFLRLRRSSNADVPTLVLNGVRAPSLDVLREIPIERVERVRYLEAAAATMRYGSLHSGAVLEVTTRDGRTRWR